MKKLWQKATSRWGGAKRGVAAIASGAFVGQLILALATPVLSRIYTPQAFGEFSTLLSIASVVGPIATLKFEAAVLLPADQNDARRLLRLGLVSCTAIGVVTVAVTAVLVHGMGVGGALGAVPFAPLWLGAMVLVTSLFSVLSQAAIRDRNYRVIATRSVVQSLGIAGGQLGAGVVTASSTGLFSGYVFGRLMGFIPLFRASRHLFIRPTGGRYSNVLKEYWRFPLVFTPSALLNTLGSQMPLLIVASVFGAAAAGQLGMSQRLVFIPATLVGAAMAEVVGSEIAKGLRSGTAGARRIYLRVSAAMAGLAVAFGAALLFFGPAIFPFILGDQWAVSGALAQAMAVSVALGLVASPLSKVFVLYQQAIASIAVDVSRVMLIGAAAFVALRFNIDVVGTVWLLYAAQGTNYLVTWVWGYMIVSRARAEG